MTQFTSQSLSLRLASLAVTPHLLICTDYDGTLAPIAPRPEQARLLQGNFNILNELAHLPNTRVAVISGRSLENLQSHSGFERPVLLIGSHGAEGFTHGPGDQAPNDVVLLEVITSALGKICATADGAWTERKPFGLTVHVRQVKFPEAQRVLLQVREAMKRWPIVIVKEGKAVIEVSLSRTNKGDAVRQLRDDWGTVPNVIYIGDDVTDEDAFAALTLADLGVKVGKGPSKAKYRVASEHAVLNMLRFVWQGRSDAQRHVHVDKKIGNT